MFLVTVGSVPDYRYLRLDMQKLIPLLRCLMLQALLLHASAAFPQQENLLNLYNWSDYIHPEVVAAFTEEYDIKVNYDIYDSSEIVDTKLLAGRSGYDLIFHGASFASRLVAIGVFQPLDKAKLSNWQNLDPKILAAIDEFDPGNRFGMPYIWGTTGVACCMTLPRSLWLLSKPWPFRAR